MSDSEIKIDEGIPVPPPGTFGPRASKYPYDTMDVGNSFFIPVTDEAGAAVAKRRMRQSTAWANKRYAPKKFTARSVAGGVRVWRTA